MTLVKVGDSKNGFVAIQNSDQFQNKKILLEGAYTILMKLKNKADE